MSETEPNEPRPEDLSQPSGSRTRAVIAVLLFCAMVGLLVAAIGQLLPKIPGLPKSPAYDPTDHFAVGQTLPALELESLTVPAESVSLDDLSGKVVLVNFWGTWCPPCQVELPHIVELDHQMADEPNFRLLAVSCGNSRPEEVEPLRSTTSAYMREQGFDIPTYADPDFQTRGAFGRIGQFQFYPTTFLMDAQHVVRGVWEGYQDDFPRQMHEAVRRVLDEE